MKKTYLVPKSETLSAILKDMCQGPSPMIGPVASGGGATIPG